MTAGVAPSAATRRRGSGRVESAHGQPGRSSVGRNVGALLASQLVTFALAAVVAVLLPRTLGPEGIGQLRLANSLWAIAAVVVAFGTPLLVVKELARDGARGGVVGQSLVAQGLLFAAASAAMAGYVVVAGYDRRAIAVIAVTGAATAVWTVGNTARAALQGLERMDYTAAADIAGKVGYVGAVVALVLLGGDERAAAGAGVLQAAVALAVALPLLRRFASIRLAAPLGTVGPLLRRSRPYLAIGAVLVVYQQIDVIVISWLVDEATIGWYSTADGLVAALYFIPVTVSTAFLPLLTRLHHEDPPAATALLRQAFGYMVAVAVPIGLGAVALGDELATQLFGDDFARSGPVLSVMGVVLIVTHLTILLGQYSIAIDRQGQWTRMMVVAAVGTVALDLVLVPLTARVFENGAIGGALAYIATEGFLLGYALFRLAPGLIDRAVLRKVGTCLAGGAAMLAVVVPLRGELLAAPIAAGALVYVVSLVALRFLGPDELRSLRASLSSRLGRRAPTVGVVQVVEESTHG